MAIMLTPVGAQFQVNVVTSKPQSSPEIAPLSDGRFVVVFQSDFSGNFTDVDILGQFVNPNGTLSGNLFVIQNPGGIQDEPAVAARVGGGLTTVWQDYGTVSGSPSHDADIYYAVTDSGGVNTVSRTRLIDGAVTLITPDIATLSDGRQIAVAELLSSNTDHDIVFNVLAADGSSQLFPGGGNVDISLGMQRHPKVAPDEFFKQALVVYDDNGGEANPNDSHITARRFNGASNTFGPFIFIADAGAGHTLHEPDVAYIGDGRFAVVYRLDISSILARIYNSDSGALSPEIAVNTAPAFYEQDATVAATQDGGFLVTWNDTNGPPPDTDGGSIHARRFDPYGNPFGDEFVVNTLTDGSQFPSAIGINGGNVLIAWTDFGSRPGDTDPPSIQAQAFSVPGFNYDSAAYGDFDNNGRSDLLFQNLSTGLVAIWTTNEAGVFASVATLGSLPAGFKIDSTGNFNSTPGDDILLRSAGTGQVAVWVTNGTAVVDFRVLGSAPAAYLNAGNGDFTGDGQSDLLFRHVGTGEIASWQVVDNALAAPAQVLGSAPNVYQIVAVADFTGDHQADILFRNLGTGEIAEWQVADNQLLSAQVVGSTASVYHVVGTGDFDGNGANDILFRHDNGELVMWLLDSAGQLLTSPTSVASVSNIYHVDGTGDLNGDGRSDIIFRDPSGNVIDWLMNGAAAQAIQTVGRASQDFSIAAHHFDLI